MTVLGRALAALVLLVFAPAAETAEAAEAVPVRGWVHNEFVRLVFDWPAPVGYTARVDGETLRIAFDRPLAADLDPVRKALAATIDEIGLDDDDRVVTAKLKGAFTVRSFVSEDAVVVDLAPRRAGRETAVPRVRVRAGEHPGFGRVVFDWPMMVDYDVDKKGRSVVVTFKRPATFDLDAVNRDPPKQMTALGVEVGPRGVSAHFTVAKGARIRHFRDATRVVLDVLGETAAPAPTAPAPVPEPRPTAAAPGPPEPRSAAAAPRPPEPRPATRGEALAPVALAPQPVAAPASEARETPEAGFRPLVSVAVERGAAGIVARFNWRDPTLAAAWRRGKELWVVFDRPARIDLGGLRVGGRGIVEAARQVPTAGAALLQIVAEERFDVAFRRDGTVWEMRLGEDADGQGPGEPIGFAVEPASAGGARAVLTVEGAARLLDLRDPTVGDALKVLVTGRSAHGLPVHRRFVGFELFKSPLGAAIRPAADDVRIRFAGGRLVVDAAKGLDLSRGAGEDGRPVVRRSLGPFASLWRWREVEGRTQPEMRTALMRRILAAPVEERNEARLDLARFYLAHGRAADAAGVLRVTARQHPTPEENLFIRAATAVANVLLGHYAEAKTTLDSPDFREDPAAAPWRAAIDAAAGDWLAASERFRGAEEAIGAIPPRYRDRLRLRALEASLTADDMKTAEKRIVALSRAPLGPLDRQRFDHLRAFQLKKSGKLRAALDIWRALSRSSDRRVRARAAFAAINAERDAGTIGDKEAIEALERLSFAWRGDAYEFDRLAAVAKLYADAGEYRAALTRYRQAASYFGDVAGAEQVTAEMSRLFRKLYLDGVADRMPPVSALALYQEFRELTPAGADGDAMIRKLAERLVAVDLLGEAAKLLEHQAEYRLKGKAKAEVGLRLATVRMLDRKPELALEALKKTRVDGLADGLRRKRRNVEASALALAGRADAALALIAGDRTPETDRLRLSIQWREGRWQRVAETAARLLSAVAVPGDKTPLDDATARLATQWAAASALAGNADRLERLRALFLDRIAGSRYAAAFRAVVGRDLTKARDFETLARQIGDLDALQSFIASDRDGPAKRPAAQAPSG